MMRETELLFDSVMREDRNVTRSVDGQLHVRQRAAGQALRDSEHRWASDSGASTLTDPNRFGLLGQGSILMLTSTANRTSPVQRGKYVMEVLLGTPPPPPPPNVPALPENSESKYGYE